MDVDAASGWCGAGFWHIPWHIPSHRGLVPTLPDVDTTVRSLPLDAVAVPAARSAGQLAPAARTAALAGAHLLVLCSRQSDPADAYETVRRLLPDHRVTVVAVPPGWRIPKLELRAQPPWRLPGPGVDTATKRNVALLVARAVGWSRLLYLDDDVRGFGAGHLGRAQVALSATGRHEAVGWAFDHFPDNSMVCHAYRLAGAWQDTFISGGALAVRVTPWTPHFPDVYNEDWLFMLRLMLRSSAALVLAGSVRQQEFDPFAVPIVADRQEFGDLLAEGLFRLLHYGQPLSLALRASYWAEQLQLRQEMIRRIQDRLGGADGSPHDAVRAALQHALAASRTMSEWPLHLADWVLAWDGDQRTWTARMASMASASDVDAALTRLGLTVHRPARACASR